MTGRAVPHLRKHLGERLRTRRKDRGLSQERLGQRSRISSKFIGEVERGEKSISVDNLYRISVALRVALPDLTDPPKVATPYRMELARHVALLEAQQRGSWSTPRRA